MADTAVYEWKKTGKDAFGNLLQDPTKPAAGGGAAPAQGSPFSTTDATRNALGGDSFGDLLKEGTKPATPSFGDLLGDVEPQRKQAVQGAYGALGEGFKPAEGMSQDSRIQMNEFDKQAAAARRAVEEKSALSGRVQTGQSVGDFGQFITQSLIPERADLGAKLSAADQAAAEQRRQNSFGNLLGLEGLGGQENLTEAQIAAGERSQDKQIASTEKIAFADLSVREKQLVQQGKQFDDELSFKKWATQGGWTQEEAGRAWQSIENEKDRTLTRSESALGRELQKYVADLGFTMDAKKLEENIRQFNSREAFDRWATQAQLDDNAKDRIWKSHESDIARKWESGERMSEQEHEVNLTRLQGEIDTGKMKLQQLLNLDTLEKTQAHDKVMASIENTYQTLRDERLFNHEEAMEATKFEYAKQLEGMGYTHEQAMQAAEIAAQAAEGERTRNHETLLAKAELAQKSEFFKAELGIDQQRVDLEKEKFRQYLTEYGDIKAGKEYEDALNLAATLSTLAGDDEDLQRFAAQTLFTAIGNMENSNIPPDMVAQGLLGITFASFSDPAKAEAWARSQADENGQPKFTDAQIAAAVAGMKEDLTGGGGSGTIEDAENAQFKIDEIMGKLPAGTNVERIRSVIDRYSASNANHDNWSVTGKTNHIGYNVAESDWKNGRVPKDRLMQHFRSGNNASLYPTSQEGMDFGTYRSLIHTGLPEEKAAEVMVELVGRDRFNKAYTALTGKPPDKGFFDMSTGGPAAQGVS